MSVEYKAKIIVSSVTDDPAVIERRVGGAPTRSWRVGDPTIPGARMTHRENAWVLEAGASREDRTLDDAVRRVLQLWDESGLKAVSDYECTLLCVVSFPNRDAILGFRKDTVAALARLGLKSTSTTT